jgi:hypothetical protein
MNLRLELCQQEQSSWRKHTNDNYFPSAKRGHQSLKINDSYISNKIDVNYYPIND